MINQKKAFDEPAHAIVVELNKQGQIIRSLQDPDGKVYTSISEVNEKNGVLFIASRAKNYIGVLDLNLVAPPHDPIIGKLYYYSTQSYE